MFYRLFLPLKEYQAFNNFKEFTLVCEKCAGQNTANLILLPVCASCFSKVQVGNTCVGHINEPFVLERKTDLQFIHQERFCKHQFDFCTIAALNTNSNWIAIDTTGHIVFLDFSSNETVILPEFQEQILELGTQIQMVVSADDRFIAIGQTQESKGLVIDLEKKKLTMQLNRGDYYPEHTPFPMAFFYHEKQQLLVHGTNWNRLDISNPESGELISKREFALSEDITKRPEHDLDYFHGTLLVSPNQQWIAEDGWVWHPSGVVRSWNLEEWYLKNVWESEDGTSLQDLIRRSYFWNAGICWLDDTQLIVYGIGDDEWIVPGVIIFDVTTGKELSRFYGPNLQSLIQNSTIKPKMVFDQFLFAFAEGNGISVWDTNTGELLLQDSSFCPMVYHPVSKTFLSVLEQRKFRLSQLQ